MSSKYFPSGQGLYDPSFEHDACGVGFVCDIKGSKSSGIVLKGLEVLERMSHRGAVGADPATGDGAGILLQIPHRLFREELSSSGIDLPERGKYGVGTVFFPEEDSSAERCIKIFTEVIQNAGQALLTFRDVPVREDVPGIVASRERPLIKQVFVKMSEDVSSEQEFERKLYVIRKMVESRVRESDIEGKGAFYITDLSCRKIIYKGLLMPDQVRNFFPDLTRENMESALALVHSRYSTNTFPAWDLAQPFRYIAHNGEINTLRGNVNWFRSGEKLLASDLFGNDIAGISPVITEGGSDSATLDNVFELLVLAGRSMKHAMMMLIPAAWENSNVMGKDLKDFYKYHACLMEPWDGPAAVAFTDGCDIGAVLDRNGLRPARYILTKDDMVIMSSEVGVMDIPPSEIKFSGRLEPGKMLFIDTKEGKIVDDDSIKRELSGKRPYGKWLDEGIVELSDIPASPEISSPLPKGDDMFKLLRSFGYSREELDEVLAYMGSEGKEPVGSMGNDTPHAFLSKRPQLLFDHFKQLFAQVTNPAIDPIREKIVMDMSGFIGPGKNLLDESPEHCLKIHLPSPILDDGELARIKDIDTEVFRSRTLYAVFDPSDPGSFSKALDRLRYESVFAVEEGCSIIVISDRGVKDDTAPLPSLLAAGAVHQNLVACSMRSRVSIIVESGEPRDVNHFALLLGFGADAVNPYLALDIITKLSEDGETKCDVSRAVENYRQAITAGILKILSKMGISTLRSYKGAQIFEILGLSEDVVSACFTGTVSRVGGVGIDGICDDVIRRHSSAFSSSFSTGRYELDTGGIFKWKRDGEFHLWNPLSITALQESVRKGDYARYKEFAELVDDQKDQPVTIRSLFKFRNVPSVPIEEVESIESIFKRFATGAMSYGSISRNAHETIAVAMNRIGGKSNTGEGGEDPERFIPMPSGDSRRSAIKQVASGRFGVTADYLVNADEIQIKIAQGAKPGEGGQLPGHKVSAVIARTRYTTQGVTLISPPPHHDIYSIEDLAQLIFDLKSVNPGAKVSVKLVSEAGVGTVAAGVAKGHADTILISGADGGTGASPKTSIRHAGLPWELGLSETHQTLVLNGLRERVRLQTDGQMRTGRDVAIAALLGAQEFGFCTVVLITLGCVMLRHCHLNNCSVGVATQDAFLEKRFTGKPEYIVNYMTFVAMHLREIMASLGIRKLEEMVGRSDLIEVDSGILPAKSVGTDLSKILYAPVTPEHIASCMSGPSLGNADNKTGDEERTIDSMLIEKSKGSIENNVPVSIVSDIHNADRTVGAGLSGYICSRKGASGLPEDTVNCEFSGYAGQSFGAFLAKGVTFRLYGMANDYVGKSLSGGRVIIRPGRGASYDPSRNIIVGNTCFYGAVAGEAYISGIAGERFCVRNSGLYAVVEGVGEHGCEYMTGGRIVIIGDVGRNFAAGMSGGIAYVYDASGDLHEKCNMEMVELSKPSKDDRSTIYGLLKKHKDLTDSARAEAILNGFDRELEKFVKVLPLEYKRVLSARAMEEKLGLGEVSDG